MGLGGEGVAMGKMRKLAELKWRCTLCEVYVDNSGDMIKHLERVHPVARGKIRRKPIALVMEEANDQTGCTSDTLLPMGQNAEALGITDTRWHSSHSN